jgi:ABC-2 type transport system ATP-binding protein
LPAAQALRQLVRSTLAAEGKTVLIATHNMDEATELCGRVAVIDSGELRAWGTPAEIARSVARGRRRLELTVDGWTEGLLRRVESLTCVVDVQASGREGESTRWLEVALEDSADAVADVVETIVWSGGRILTLREERPSLAELFLLITRPRADCAVAGPATPDTISEAGAPVETYP